MKKTTIIFAFLSFIISCGNKDTDSSSFEFAEDSETLDLTIALKNEVFTVSDLIDSIKIISLKTSVSSLLSGIRDVIITPEYIYILDSYQNGSVAIFDSAGNFIKRIMPGRGPGETNCVTRISYDKVNSRLLTYQTFLVNEYSKDGQFVKNHRIKYLINDFIVTDVGVVCVQNENSNIENTFTVFEKKLFTDEENEHISKCNEHIYALSMDNHFIKQTSNNIISILRPLDNNIYKYKDGQVTIRYKLIFDELDVKGVKKFFDYLAIQKEDLYSFLGKFFETDNYQYFIFQNSQYPVYVYRNKMSGKTISGHKEIVDNNFIPGRMVTDYGKFFVKLLEPEVLADDIKEIILSNPHISKPDKNLIQNFKSGDNPILVLYSLKDDMR